MKAEHPGNAGSCDICVQDACGITLAGSPESSHSRDGRLSDTALTADDGNHLFDMGSGIGLDLEIGLRRSHFSCV